MNIKKFIPCVGIIAAVGASQALSSCDDQIMEWKESDSSISLSDIPLQLSEQIALYDYVKNYVATYHTGLNVACGIGADLYLSDADYRTVVDANFTGVTLGNAMKHQSVVSANGALNFTTIDNIIATLPADMKLYGHNFIWHTQQQQSYLKSLIAPTMVVTSDSGSDIVNVLSGDSNDFEGGTTGNWGCWGSYTPNKDVYSPGHGNSDYCMSLTNPTDGNMWDAQCAYTFDDYLDPEETYKVRFYARSESGAGQVQFQYQNSSTYGSQGAYNTFDAPSDWVLCEAEFQPAYDDVNRIIINFGSIADTYYIDDIEFGTIQEVSSNLCDNGDFSNGTNGWTIQNSGAGVEVVEVSDAPSGNKNVLKMTASSSSSNAWDLQVKSPDIPIITEGAKVELSFFVKSEGDGQGRVSFSSDLSSQYPWMNWTGSQSSWTEAFETSTSWTQIDVILQNYSTDFVDGSTTWSFNLDMGYVADMTYYIDNVSVTEIVEEPSAAPKRKATTITYTLKSAQEKREILLDAMEQWIKAMAEHVGDHVDAWDVVNEPISDSGGWRGINGVFGGTWSEDDATYYDSEPTESEESGLSLNWGNTAGNGHFYWGYYIGKDYAAKAFEYARKYAPNAKLFVNEYNLETSPSKLAQLIEFVNYIDQNGGHVDGIGTQMHVSSTITRDQVDTMFKTMAATGKLVRITELDIQIGTTSPTTAQLQEQAECYQMILTSFFENVPEAQQSAITIWGLSDNANEHEYWLPNDSPNLFDSSYARKQAYKGVCDAIAGYDVSEDFTGVDWTSIYTE